MADASNCHWKTDCSVKFPLDPLLVSTDVADIISCAGDTPKFLRVANARCAKRKEITDMQLYKKKVHKKKGREGKGKKQDKVILRKMIKLKEGKQGIITSHTTYPWSYSNTLFRNFRLNETVEYITTFRWPKQKTFARTKKLLVGVRVRGICDTEELKLKAYDSVGPLNEDHNACTWEYTKATKRKNPRGTKRKNTTLTVPDVSQNKCDSTQYFKKNRKLELRFKRTPLQPPHDYKTCGGFLLCFKVVDKDVTISGHVCDLVADKVPCITERGTFTEKCEQTRKIEDCCCPNATGHVCDEAYTDMEEYWNETMTTKTSLMQSRSKPLKPKPKYYTT